MVIMALKLKQPVDSETTDVGLPRGNTDDIISKTVSATVRAVKEELLNILNTKLDTILKDLKTKDKEIVQLK